jgi:hypothetical protein
MFPTELPWYRSKIIVGAIISLITKLLVITGVLDSTFNDEALTDGILLVVGVVADLFIGYQRVTQKAAPAITGS